MTTRASKNLDAGRQEPLYDFLFCRHCNDPLDLGGNDRYKVQSLSPCGCHVHLACAREIFQNFTSGKTHAAMCPRCAREVLKYHEDPQYGLVIGKLHRAHEILSSLSMNLKMYNQDNPSKELRPENSLVPQPSPLPSQCSASTQSAALAFPGISSHPSISIPLMPPQILPTISLQHRPTISLQHRTHFSCGENSISTQFYISIIKDNSVRTIVGFDTAGCNNVTETMSLNLMKRTSFYILDDRILVAPCGFKQCQEKRKSFTDLISGYFTVPYDDFAWKFEQQHPDLKAPKYEDFPPIWKSDLDKWRTVEIPMPQPR